MDKQEIKAKKNIFKIIADKFYDLQVKLNKPKKRIGGFKSKKIKDSLFYAAIITIPLIVLVFETVFINLNSIFLAFKQYGEDGSISWAGFNNFKKVIDSISIDPFMPWAIKNSLVIYFVSVIVTAVIPILFSYYLF